MNTLAKTFLDFLFSKNFLNSLVVVLGAVIATVGFRIFLNMTGIQIRRPFWKMATYIVGLPLWVALGIVSVFVAFVVVPFGIVLPFCRIRKPSPRPKNVKTDINRSSQP